MPAAAEFFKDMRSQAGYFQNISISKRQGNIWSSAKPENHKNETLIRLYMCAIVLANSELTKMTF